VEKPGTIPACEALPLQGLITPTEQGIASRVLARTGGGNLTLFAFDAGQELSEHTAPFGALDLTIGGQRLRAAAGTVTRMPANVPHALEAPVAARMLLLMLREPKEAK
jgi:quercetin dioxygenase-like cupin family protein